MISAGLLGEPRTRSAGNRMSTSPFPGLAATITAMARTTEDADRLAVAVTGIDRRMWDQWPDEVPDHEPNVRDIGGPIDPRRSRRCSVPRSSRSGLEGPARVPPSRVSTAT